MGSPITIFLQARMSSSRYPGKVLAPFRGKPILSHVIHAARTALPQTPLVLLTSEDPSDDPLVAYAEDSGITVFRGPLKDVFSRFRLAAESVAAGEWVLRLSGDSPLLNPRVIQAVVERAGEEWDLVTTVFPRTFPKGTNAELIRVRTLMEIPVRELTDEDREHVTPYFYRNASSFRIRNVTSGNEKLTEINFCVDTLEDLKRLEKTSEEEIRKTWDLLKIG